MTSVTKSHTCVITSRAAKKKCASRRTIVCPRQRPGSVSHVDVPGRYLDESTHDTGMNADPIEPEQLRDAAAESITIPPEDGRRPGDPLKKFLPGDLEPATDEQIDATRQALDDDLGDSDLPRVNVAFLHALLRRQAMMRGHDSTATPNTENVGGEQFFADRYETYRRALSQADELDAS